MISKKTDYTNAQFEDATLRIKKLFDEISKQDTPGSESEIAIFFRNLTFGWWHNSNTIVYVAYKKNGKVNMMAFAVMWASGSFYGMEQTIDVPAGKEWGIPPRSYHVESAGGSYMDITPSGSGIKFGRYCEGEDPDPSMFLQASWNY